MVASVPPEMKASKKYRASFETDRRRRPFNAGRTRSKAAKVERQGAGDAWGGRSVVW